MYSTTSVCRSGCEPEKPTLPVLCTRYAGVGDILWRASCLVTAPLTLWSSSLFTDWYIIMSTLVFLSLAWVSVNAEITVNVLGPSALAEKYPDGISGVGALYGSLPYGSYAAGRLLKARNCCSACEVTGFNATIPTLFLVPYGTCAPDVKTHMAQAAGAKAVLFYFNTSLSADSMSGSGSYYPTVPSLLLSPSVYQDLSSTQGDIYLNITLTLSPLTYPVPVGFAFALEAEYDQYLAPFLRMLASFEMYNTTFTPYYYIFRGTRQTSVSNCLFDRKYCAIGRPYGSVILREVIRQTCAYQLSLQSGSYSIYQNYINVWFSQCLYIPQVECTSAMGLYTRQIQACYNASFEYANGNNTEATDNSILRDLQLAFFNLSIRVVPAVIVGQEMVYGELEEESWKRAICAQTSKPDNASYCGKYFCAQGCWVDMLDNGLCDPACNVKECSYDNGNCENPLILPVPSLEVVANETGGSNSTTTGTGAQGGNEPTSPSNGGSGTNTTNTTTPSPSTNTTTTSPPTNTTTTSPTNTTTTTTPPTNTTTTPASTCSPGCDSLTLTSHICHSVCNVSACDYQNWVCTCSPGCTPAFFHNELCDNVCNTQECGYDNGYCTRKAISVFPEIEENTGQDDDPEWKKGVIIAGCVVSFM